MAPGIEYLEWKSSHQESSLDSQLNSSFMKSSVNLLLNVTALQLSQVKCTLEDSINEFIIEELNLLVFAAKPTSNSNPLHSCKHNER